RSHRDLRAGRGPAVGIGAAVGVGAAVGRWERTLILARAERGRRISGRAERRYRERPNSVAVGRERARRPVDELHLATAERGERPEVGDVTGAREPGHAGALDVVALDGPAATRKLPGDEHAAVALGGGEDVHDRRRTTEWAEDDAMLAEPVQRRRHRVRGRI